VVLQQEKKGWWGDDFNFNDEMAVGSHLMGDDFNFNDEMAARAVGSHLIMGRLCACQSKMAAMQQKIIIILVTTTTNNTTHYYNIIFINL